MKNFFFTVIASVIVAFTGMAADSTPEPAISSNNVPAAVSSTNTVTLQATLNDVVIDILRGAKSAGSEVYQASKSAVVASVDFAKQQVPDVVEQFLKWKITERVVYIIGWLIVAFSLYLLSKKATAWTDKYRVEKLDELHHPYKFTDYEIGMVLKWASRVAAITIITINVWVNGMTISKIVIAPKVYLIEYVVDTINNNRPHNGNR